MGATAEPGSVPCRGHLTLGTSSQRLRKNGQKFLLLGAAAAANGVGGVLVLDR
jgi:hypothetical protein